MPGITRAEWGSAVRTPILSRTHIISSPPQPAGWADKMSEIFYYIL
jgi:hypothetical protein